MAPTTTSWDVNLYNPELSSITADASNSAPKIYDKLVEVTPYSKEKFPTPNKVVTHRVAGLGPFEAGFEAGPYAQGDLIKGPKKTTAYKKFNLSVEFTEEVLDDDMFGICRQYAKSLGEKYEQTRDILTAQIYDTAFVATNYSDADGQAICSLAHPRYDNSGLVRKNMLTVSKALSYTSIQELMLVSDRQVDERGLPAPQFKPSQKIIVLVQPEDRFKCVELFAQLANYRPTDDTNAVNVLRSINEQFEVVVNPYQSAVGAAGRYWFLINANQPDIWLVDRKPLITKSYVKPDNDNMVYAGRGRFCFHVNHWRGILGSGN